MSRMLSKMNLISVVQQLPKDDIETIQGYVEMIEEENQQLKNDINKLQKELNEENLQCSKYAIEFNDLKEKNKQLKIQISAREEKYRELEDKYKELDKMCELYSKSLYNAELNQYKNNWNKLKVYIKTEIPEDVFIDTEWFVSILDKMQELEGSDSDE